MRFSELEGRIIGVWGAGVETRSFATILAKELPTARIAVVVIEDPTDVAPEITDGAIVVDAAAASNALAGCDVVVRGPGVPLHRDEFRAVAAIGVPIATPTGLWMAERGGRNVIGITATKGKSTTAKLIHHLVKATGQPVHLAGNIGRPALELLHASEDELAVVELSSFQIADLVCGPEVAMASNLHAEHLDWHTTMEVYTRDKLRLLSLPGVRRCVLNERSPEVMAAPRSADAEVFLYGNYPGWNVLEDGSIALGHERVVPFDRLPLIGDHNSLNICGALTALAALGFPYPELPEALADFVGLRHRLQIVHGGGDIMWIDDSISTTPVTAAEAINGVRKRFRDRPVILVGGGYERDQDYAELGRLIAQTGTRVLGLPDTGARLVEATRAAGAGAEQAHAVADMDEAVMTARRIAAPGTLVLLSPGAASYNQYKNFQHRGAHFLALARAGMHRDERNGLRVYRFDTLPADRVDALVSTRMGGASNGPYASLNLGLRVGDDAATVIVNREQLFAAYGLALNRSVWCLQVHADDVTVITEAELTNANDGRDRGAYSEDTIIAKTDALVTDVVGVPLCVTLADCVPVVIYDAAHHAVGLAHAGWGGTVARIASRTVAVMAERYGSDPFSLLVGIGPSISPERYEVKRDVIERVRASYGDAQVLVEQLDGTVTLDLWEANALDLEQAGVPRSNIETAAISTIDRLDEFYSYRVERTTGRFVTAVTLRA